MAITFQLFHLDTFYARRWCISFLVDVFLLPRRSKNPLSDNWLGTSVYELSKYDNLETGILWCCHLVMHQMFCLTSKKTMLCKFLLLMCELCHFQSHLLIQQDSSFVEQLKKIWECLLIIKYHHMMVTDSTVRQETHVLSCVCCSVFSGFCSVTVIDTVTDKRKRP